MANLVLVAAETGGVV